MNYKIENGNITVRLADYIELLECACLYLECLSKSEEYGRSYNSKIEEIKQQINLLKEQL